MKPNLEPSQLVALHALLEERHVTRAAKRLGLTQSSMSHRLRQLREAFADPLLVSASGGLVLTPRAASMAGPLAEALQSLWRSVADAPAFEPSRATFQVTLALPDLLTPLLSSLMTELKTQAPGADLRLLNIPADLPEALGRGAPAFAIAPTSFVSPNIVARRLGALRFGVASRKGHPIGKRKLSVERWLAYPHVVVRIDNQRANVVEQELGKRGLERRVGLEVPSFLAGLLVTARSDLLMNAPVPLAGEVAKYLNLDLRPAPILLPKVPFALVWHERFKTDPAHRWTRELLFDVARRHLSEKVRA